MSGTPQPKEVKQLSDEVAVSVFETYIVSVVLNGKDAHALRMLAKNNGAEKVDNIRSEAGMVLVAVFKNETNAFTFAELAKNNA